MKILVTNDDGVYAEGICTLADELRKIADVRVIAPDRNHSGASNSLTLSRPLTVTNLGNEVYAVEGTPTDCVHLAVTGLFDDVPDMVVSGINEGSNLGDDILYSGTVAAATEGRFLGLPAIAISLTGKLPTHYKTAADVAKNLVLRMQKEPLQKSMILNVNVPDVLLEEIAGYEVCRLGARHCSEPTVKSADPRGNPIYWIGPSGPEQDAGQGTDFHAISSKKVSITPVKIDLTDYKAFDPVSSWLTGLAN